jgi:hypothetical protein
MSPHHIKVAGAKLGRRKHFIIALAYSTMCKKQSLQEEQKMFSALYFFSFLPQVIILVPIFIHGTLYNCLWEIT